MKKIIVTLLAVIIPLVVIYLIASDVISEKLWIIILILIIPALIPILKLILNFYYKLEKLKLLREKENREIFSKKLDLLHSSLKGITEPAMTSDDIFSLMKDYPFLVNTFKTQDTNKKEPIYYIVSIIIREKQKNNAGISEQQKDIIKFNKLTVFFNTLFQILKFIKNKNNKKQERTYIEDIIQLPSFDKILPLLKIYTFAENKGDKFYEYHCLVKKYFPE